MTIFCFLWQVLWLLATRCECMPPDAQQGVLKTAWQYARLQSKNEKAPYNDAVKRWSKS